MKKIHLDTDIGGDMDDLCALAMLLRMPDVEITAITTCAEENGRRAGYVRRALELEGRTDIPFAAGVDVAEWPFRFNPGYPPDERSWGGPVAPAPGDSSAALRLLKSSIDSGAALVGIGPYTNFHFLEQRYPGTLAQAELILMGGCVDPVRAGFPPWGNDMDYNIQLDICAAQSVLAQANPLLVPLTVTVETTLRRAYLPGLRSAGPIANRIASQAEVFGEDWQNESRYGLTCPGLPADTINFQHDPLTCAIAVGWMDGVEIEEIPLTFEVQHGWLTELRTPNGKPTRIVTRIHAARFNQFWYDVMTASGQTIRQD